MSNIDSNAQGRRVGADLRRMIGFFIGCAEHGIWRHPDLPLDIGPVRCRLLAWHKGPHDFGLAGDKAEAPLTGGSDE